MYAYRIRRDTSEQLHTDMIQVIISEKLDDFADPLKEF